MQREKPAKEVRDWLGARCAQILATYREKCSENAPIGQLILPEALKLLPLYSNCIMKHDALCGAQDMSTDDRSWIQVRIQSFGGRFKYNLQLMVPSLRVEQSVFALYSRCIPLLSVPNAVLQGDFSEMPMLARFI